MIVHRSVRDVMISNLSVNWREPLAAALAPLLGFGVSMAISISPPPKRLRYAFLQVVRIRTLRA